MKVAQTLNWCSSKSVLLYARFQRLIDETHKEQDAERQRKEGKTLPLRFIIQQLKKWQDIYCLETGKEVLGEEKSNAAHIY